MKTTITTMAISVLALTALACGDDEGSGGDGGGGSSSSSSSSSSGSGGSSSGSGGSSSGSGGSSSGSGGSAQGGGAAAPSIGPCAMLPADNMWNTDISQAPVDALSEAYVASIGAATNLHADFGTEWNGAPNGIPYVLVAGDQPLVPVSFTWADESDAGPYPIPPDAPIEGGPGGDGDRHVLVVETDSCTLYETYNTWPDGAGWSADAGAIWHLGQNEQRPDGWTSADASGMAILPGLVRYDEVMEQGEILHALRVTVSAAQSAYIHPATHSDGVAGSDPNAPPMGLRLRLRADFDMSGYSEPIQVMLRAMQRFGLVVADSGGDWYVSGAPDPRWDDDVLHELQGLVGADFEAIETGPIYPY